MTGQLDQPLPDGNQQHGLDHKDEAEYPSPPVTKAPSRPISPPPAPVKQRKVKAQRLNKKVLEDAAVNPFESFLAVVDVDNGQSKKTEKGSELKTTS